MKPICIYCDAIDPAGAYCLASPNGEHEFFDGDTLDQECENYPDDELIDDLNDWDKLASNQDYIIPGSEDMQY